MNTQHLLELHQRMKAINLILDIRAITPETRKAFYALTREIVEAPPKSTTLIGFAYPNKTRHNTP